MTLPALPELNGTSEDLAAVRARLVAVRDSLKKACAELEAQIAALDELSRSGKAVAGPSAAPNLFETEPVPPLPVEQEAATIPPAPAWQAQPPQSIVMEAKGPMALDPELEQATLEELNKALGKAFAQISNRHPWAG